MLTICDSVAVLVVSEDAGVSIPACLLATTDGADSVVALSWVTLSVAGGGVLFS